ncbi:MAG: hypothetical protein A2X42_11860 [Candidatus Margulisbacteria bacterium GWF2_38_17]|nr:MAG: hypothetical protein A2X43_12545 [Candidatus Margulisbacteria bacterium GWD2_39_127]OGI01924.1 MAG: hypothetical protein A2X42_11860 [Candidatus Margulisbacteria bacterium GWF2_38_17]OGI11572.1 MAG: hypothetical protein A2X41_10085 [Candidatus Margulisbacteria bacterium GWE2_39_32]
MIWIPFSFRQVIPVFQQAIPLKQRKTCRFGTGFTCRFISGIGCWNQNGLGCRFKADFTSQFTSAAFTEILIANNIQISMDGKGRASDNIIIERFFQSLKYENVYRYEYKSLPDLKLGIARYLTQYNHFRIHESLGYKTPASVYGILAKELAINNILVYTKRNQLLKKAV